MFEDLYQRVHVLARHREGSHAQERADYLALLAAQGWCCRALTRKAELVLWVVQLLPLAPGDFMTHDQIQRGAETYAHRKSPGARDGDRVQARNVFVREATHWFRFLNRLREPTVTPLHNEGVLSDFCHWMKHERGLSGRTIQNRDRWVREFLTWYELRRRSLSAMSARDVDAFFTASNQNQRWSRVTTATILNALRTFFRYAANRGLCERSIAEGLSGPRVYSHASLPLGPKREDVIRLLESMETDRPVDVRDRGMVLLCAVYGLRASEVTGLKLDDIDWDREQIHVGRAKSRVASTFPLIPLIGNAIFRYLRDVRPPSPHREVFLTLCSPFRPLRVMYTVISERMEALGIDAIRQGPHGLRHALACHLLSQKQPLKVIGDILGHRSCQSTRIYAKVDLDGLRHLARFDLRGVL
ncbi:MAG: tyrosine-type recombinase/integrase [Planctomycetaceae bacterium]